MVSEVHAEVFNITSHQEHAGESHGVTLRPSGAQVGKHGIAAPGRGQGSPEFAVAVGQRPADSFAD
jgi:hypothetical protein